jgi:hypothetical protein
MSHIKSPLRNISPSAVRWIATEAGLVEKHLNLGDLTRAMALKELKKVTGQVVEAHPECDGLWFSISKRKLWGRYIVVWGIGNQPTLPE